MAIEVLNKQRLVGLNQSKLADLASAALRFVRKSRKGANASSPNAASAEAQITLVFVRDKKIRELNRDYRGKDYPTDVLSFRATNESEESFGFGAENYLGDIVISTDTALRQAQEAEQRFEREVEELVIHGVLHLCGYDHETDNGEMNRLELKVRKKLLDED